MTELSKKWLITTPDYPPQLGGLSTYTLCVEEALKICKIPYDVKVWRSPQEARAIDDKGYKKVLNINYVGGYLGQWQSTKNINFIHGSEILFYSPNIFKRILKRLMKDSILDYFRTSQRNIFISRFTMEKLESLGLNINYSRDQVFHNCIDTTGHKFIKNDIESEIKFVCIVRDVPHKNLDGVVDLLEELSQKLDKKIVLYTNSERLNSSKIEIVAKDKLSDEQRDEYYRGAHFNLLLSKDHSHRGFYEGFGLTCLEAGMYGVPSIVAATGGLPENVHHMDNGLVVGDNFIEDFKTFISEYSRKREFTYEHTIESHSIEAFARLFKTLEME
jgi:glycosyltransferase involved in cell wall biosynthesis